MVLVERGTFTMGCTHEQVGECKQDEKPAHTVTISTFYISKYEVTQEEYSALVGADPYQKCPHCPVGNIYWEAAQTFIKKLDSLTGKKYRLPTEAEWEFAARGGNKTKGFKYSGSNNVKQVAWISDNSKDSSHVVGQKKPNELGLYDMSGNVYEWCSDWYDENYYAASSKENPKGGKDTGREYATRGGSAMFGANQCRVSTRSEGVPEFWIIYSGFRLVMDK